MTIDEIKETLESHLAHWKRLLAEGICNEQEGKKTIEALQAAIRSLEAWEKVWNSIYEWNGIMRVLMDKEAALEIIENHLKEVTDDECLD